MELNEAITEAFKPKLVAEKPMLITEAIQRPLRVPRPFVLWWSTLTQSILQLLRQRTLTTTFVTTAPFPNFPLEDPNHNVNDVAAGLDMITVDAPPVFDLPLE